MKILLLIVFVSICGSSHAQQADYPEAKLKDLNEAKRSYEYRKMYADVHQVRTDCNLADQGLIKNITVVNEYNKLIGPYLGRKLTLQQVRYVINKKGDALIKIALYKAASRIALDKSAVTN